MIQENQDEGADVTDAGEGDVGDGDFVQVPRSEYEKTNQTIGSLKRENKDFKKRFEDFNRPTETPPTNKPSDDINLGELAYHNTKPDGVRVVHDDDVEYLKATMKETGKPMKDVLSSRFFQSELKDRQEARLVVNATPTSTRRAGEQGNHLEIAYTQYLQTGKLPSDPDLRMAVVNKRYEREKMASQMTSQSVVEN